MGWVIHPPLVTIKIVPAGLVVLCKQVYCSKFSSGLLTKLLKVLRKKVKVLAHLCAIKLYSLKLVLQVSYVTLPPCIGGIMSRMIWWITIWTHHVIVPTRGVVERTSTWWSGQSPHLWWVEWGLPSGFPWIMAWWVLHWLFIPVWSPCLIKARVISHPRARMGAIGRTGMECLMVHLCSLGGLLRSSGLWPCPAAGYLHIINLCTCKPVGSLLLDLEDMVGDQHWQANIRG
jgi:hypothetical protein